MSSIQDMRRELSPTPADIGQNLEEVSQRSVEPVAIRRHWYLPVKFCLDWLGALVLLILTAPFTFLGIFLIKLTSPGPAFYLQTRLGQNNTKYKVIKLRTMIHNAEAKTGAVWSQAGDPRVTNIGRILRKTHIDEFPQLINVLLGQMSLVGPRPERPEIALKLAWNLDHYEDRTLVKPGITGLAQLRLPPDSDMEGVRRKLACDLYYVKEVSPWLDLRIFVFTGWLFAEVFLKAAWRRIYVPDARCIKESIDCYFPEGIDLKPRSDLQD